MSARDRPQKPSFLSGLVADGDGQEGEAEIVALREPLCEAHPRRVFADDDERPQACGSQGHAHASPMFLPRKASSHWSVQAAGGPPGKERGGRCRPVPRRRIRRPTVPQWWVGIRNSAAMAPSGQREVIALSRE